MSEFRYEIVKDPEIFQENRMPAHSDHDYFRSEAEQKSGHMEMRHLMNGSWYFSYAKNYASAVADFFETGYDCRRWDTIQVPGHIQMQGYGVPQYVNTQYPWDGSEKVIPGEIPEKFNPVASYVKYFRLPADMKEGPVYISFQGVESGFALWLNGTYIGYSEDSFTPSEFDLSAVIDREGENKLAVMVFRFTAGSWCEDQDFFRFSGIFRDVYLYTVPKTHVWDLHVKTILDDAYEDATLLADLKVGGAGAVNAELLAEDGTLAAQTEIPAGKQGGAAGLQTVSFSIPVKSPEKWSAEHPNLYSLKLTVTDEDGTPAEVIVEQVGFRRFEIKNRIMCLNGKRILFHGVDRHEFSASSGRCIKDEEILKDILTMKRNNINAIRTSHYPNRTLLYRLCDRYGIYLIDETNLETHGVWDMIVKGKEPLEFCVPGDRPEFQELILDRARNMFERDKNHASVLIWSCGNESFGGKDLQVMHDSFHQWDDTRPVHYEGVMWDKRYPDTTDIASSMYTPVVKLREYLQEKRDKPYILCEYTHAMGNSCGAMHKYTDYMNEEPLFQGAFIWDYIDQSITKKDRYGREFQAYGGDFDDRPNDGSFSGNGIVYGKDRDASPKMQEVRFNYQYFSFDITREAVTVTNRSLFTDASEYTLALTLEKEGKLVECWEGTVNCPPVGMYQEKLTDSGNGCGDIYGIGKAAVPFCIPEDDGEYVLTASLKLSEDTLWASRGHEVAFGQKVFGRMPAFAYEDAPLHTVLGWNNTGVQEEGFTALFSGLHGGMVSLKKNGREMLKQSPRPNFWRPMTENDTANMLPFRAGQWKLASMYQTHKTVGDYLAEPYSVEETENTLKVSYTYHLGTRPAASCRLAYEVHADGWIDVALNIDASAEIGEMPEFGVIFPMDADFSNVMWYGIGPDETYPDRDHAKLGVYRNTAADNMAKYLVPQECGNKTGVRFAEITDENGRGIRIEGDALNLSVLPYSPHEIDCARHQNELPLPLYTWVRVSLQQMGIGGDDTWGAKTHPEYLIDNSRPLELKFRMKAI